MSITILEEEIQSDIDERKGLLLQTKTIPLRYNFSNSDEQHFINYSIPIIYSIWEGFVQTTFQTYIREINRLNLSIDLICKPILIHNIESKFKQLRQYPDKLPRKVKFLSELRSFFNTNPIYVSPTVNTQSNVGFNVLNGLLASFNLGSIPEYPQPGFSLKVELDDFLLKIRNDVAHGQNAILVNRDDVERAIKLVELLMDLMYSKIREGFLTEESHLEKEIE